MKTKSKRTLLFCLCVICTFFLVASFFTLKMENLAVAESQSTQTQDLEANIISTNFNIDNAFISEGILMKNATTSNHKFRFLTVNLAKVFESSNVNSFILEIEEFNSGWFTPIVFDKYGNYYQAMGAATGTGPASDGKFEYKKSSSLEDLTNATVVEKKGWGSVGSANGVSYYEFSVENFMWRYTANNYCLETNTLSVATGNSFKAYQNDNAIMSVGVMNYTGDSGNFYYIFRNMYARTDNGIVALADLSVCDLITIGSTIDTATVTKPNVAFVASITTGKINDTNITNVSAVKYGGKTAVFDGVKAQLHKYSRYYVIGFSLDATGANANFNGQLTDVKSIIVQVDTSVDVKIRPMIIDENGYFLEAFGKKGGSYPYRFARSIESLNYQANDNMTDSSGNWGALGVTSSTDKYLEMPISNLMCRGIFTNYRDLTTSTTINNYESGSNINVKALGITIGTETDVGSVLVGDWYYRNSNNEIIKIASAKDFTVGGNISSGAGYQFNFTTSAGTEGKVSNASASNLTCKVVNSEIGANLTTPENGNLRAILPQIKSSAAEKDALDKNTAISDYSQYQGVSYTVNNLTDKDVTFDLFVQFRKTDASWLGDSYAKNGVALFIPENGSPFVSQGSVVPKGFNGKVIIPLSKAGFGRWFERDSLTIMTNCVFIKVENNAYYNAPISELKLIADFPETLIDEENNKMFGLNGEYTMAKVTFKNGEEVLSEVDFDGSSISMPVAKQLENKTFIGWEYNGNIYAPDFVIDNITEDVVFNAVYLDFNTIYGASIRVDEIAGIRFSAQITTEDYEYIKGILGENATFGIRIIRGGTHYLDITANYMAEKVIGEVNYTVYNGVILNMTEQYYNVAYNGQAYVDIVYYGESVATRVYTSTASKTTTLAEMAEILYNREGTSDAIKEQMLKYFNKGE